MEKFRLTLSDDFVKANGKPTFPDFDLTPLETNPAIEMTWAKASNGAIRRQDLEGKDALILLEPRITRENLPDDGRLAMVARFGVGFDNVDVEACTAKEIAVVITPDGVRRPVAVSIITFMLALAGRLKEKDQIVRGGSEGWAKKMGLMGHGLVGKSLGSLGIGNIGAELFRLAHVFDMTFIAHDPYADPAVAKSLGVRMVPIETLFRESDYLSVNCPLNDETRHIVSAKLLALMKPTAFFINTARGPIVDQAALTTVLRERKIAGAALDVFEKEPTAADDPIFGLDNVIAAPHALCWTDQCFAGVGAADVKAVLDVMAGKPPVGMVNRQLEDDPGWRSKIEAIRTRLKPT